MLTLDVLLGQWFFYIFSIISKNVYLRNNIGQFFLISNCILPSKHKRVHKIFVRNAKEKNAYIKDLTCRKFAYQKQIVPQKIVLVEIDLKPILDLHKMWQLGHKNDIWLFCYKHLTSYVLPCTKLHIGNKPCKHKEMHLLAHKVRQLIKSSVCRKLSVIAPLPVLIKEYYSYISIFLCVYKVSRQNRRCNNSK